MKGWIEYHCPEHGFLVETTAKASVWCKCRKKAKQMKALKRHS